MFESAKIPASWFLPSETNIVITNQCMILYNNIGKIWIYIIMHIYIYIYIYIYRYTILYNTIFIFWSTLHVLYADPSKNNIVTISHDNDYLII